MFICADIYRVVQKGSFVIAALNIQSFHCTHRLKVDYCRVVQTAGITWASLQGQKIALIGLRYFWLSSL